MRRVIQCSATILLLSSTSFAFAAGYDYTKEDLSGYSLQPNFKVAKSSSDESNFSRNGHAVYFYGGYMYTYRFLNSSSQTLVGPGGATIAYTPKNIYSTSFPAGFEIGFGKELSQHIDFQMAYLQELQQKKSGTVHGFAFTTETKVNNLLSDVNFVFNPDDMFQVSAKIGVMASQFQNSASVEGSSYFSLSNDTKIDPAIGMDFLLQFSKNMGLRFGTLYTADMDSTNSSGELNGTVMLNYAL